MRDMLILAEKPSAYKHMIKAFGGVTGTFHGQTYKLTHSAGHLLRMMMPTYYSKTKKRAMPTKMLKTPSPDVVKKYADWSNMDAIPWNPNDFTWAKKLIGSFQRKLFNNIKRQSRDCKSIVIATDDDPDTKEGDLLGYEIVQRLHWNKPVYRIRFADENVKSLRTALLRKKNMKDPSEWGCYLKANARSHFDYLTIPLTRIATYAARHSGYNTIVNEGRLKSVILCLVYKRILARRNYVKHPYYEVRFKDTAGHKYSRSLRTDEDKAKARHQSRSDGQNALQQYQPSPIGKVTMRKVTQAPGRLLNLTTLDSRLANKYKINDINSTYEKLYEAQYVSYPRTADKKITQADFDALLPKVDSIANVVGVDKSLLTHRTLRSKFRIKHEDHGANRPGPNVPTSLSSLASVFGQCGADIYSLVARNYLSIMAEDAVYKRVKASLQKYPNFTTSFRIPVAFNWKKVYRPDESNKDNGTADMSWKDAPANPFLYSGANPKPSAPTVKWIMRCLQRVNVGTAATQGSTVGQLTKTGHNRKLKQSGQKVTISQSGAISAVEAMNTYIGSAKETKRLSAEMNRVMDPNDKFNTSDLEQKATELVQHDKAIMLKMGSRLPSLVGKPKGALAKGNYVSKPKATATVGGKSVKFNKVWGGHKFTPDELKALSSGQSISFKGKYGPVTGSLAKQSFKGHTFYGFKMHRAKKSNRYYGKLRGHSVSFKKVWSKHQFTPSEAKQLLAGKTISITAVSRRGRQYPVKVSLGKCRYKGHSFYGIIPHFK